MYGHMLISIMALANISPAQPKQNSSSQALMLYSPQITVPLGYFKEKYRTFEFPGISDEIKIKQNWIEHGVAAVVWEAAIELSKYLIENVDLNKKRIIELGAGTGLVGIIAAKRGATVTSTDLLSALPLLRKNIKINSNGDQLNITIRELEWGKHLHKFNSDDYDYIIGADIVYIEDTFPDLVTTLQYLANNNNKTRIFLSCKLRYEREMCFINMVKQFADVTEVYINSQNEIAIFEAVLL